MEEVLKSRITQPQFRNLWARPFDCRNPRLRHKTSPWRGNEFGIGKIQVSTMGKWWRFLHSSFQVLEFFSFFWGFCRLGCRWNWYLQVYTLKIIGTKFNFRKIGNWQVELFITQWRHIQISRQKNLNFFLPKFCGTTAEYRCKNAHVGYTPESVNIQLLADLFIV